MTQVDREPEADFVPGQLLKIKITTSLGASYEFPDMDARAAATIIRQAQRRDRLDGAQLTLVNASGACLVLPTRIVQGLCVSDGPPAALQTLHWVRPR